MSVSVAISLEKNKTSYYSTAQLNQLKADRIPHHVAIIPDGNRRWAKNNGFPDANKGHEEGANVILDTVKAAKELNIRYITIYCFSTENWNRSPREVAALILLFHVYLSEQCEEMVEEGIKLETIGDLTPFPEFLLDTIQNTKEATKNCDKVTLILAMNYGSRNELSRAFSAMLEDYENKKLDKHLITENTISSYLDTSLWPDPDLLIRTSGEYRISNFLSWQIAYAEIHVANTLWPNFTSDHLFTAILDFQSRERRWGGA